MIITKSAREIELMKEAGKILSKVFVALEKKIAPGVSTYELNQIAEDIIFSNGCLAPCKGYYDYPAATCISVNDTLIHGIPSTKIILREGDIVSIDIVVSYHGYCADATRTYAVGVIKDNAKRLIETTKASFDEAVKLIKPGVHLGDICYAIQSYNESRGYNVARDFTGHGIGSSMHEDPSVPNHGKPGTGPLLQSGMALAIEPMVLEGRKDTRILPDGWTVKSRDGKLTCHYENTVIVTDDGYEIITKREGEE